MTPDSPRAAWMVESPNWRARGAGDEVALVVLHGTWMTDDKAALVRLCDKAAEVSCHYYIMRSGEVVQLVAESKVAWHAGQSVWQGREGVNGFSLGIEIGNRGPFVVPPTPEMERSAEVDWMRSEPYGDAQYTALIGLLRDIMARYPAVRIVGHDEVSPGRKSDPGPHFDWARLRDAGLPVVRAS